MRTSTDRILTTHVGSIPRPENIRSLLRARVAGELIDEAELGRRVVQAVDDVVRQQAEIGLDVVSDGEMSKTSFLAYTDERLTGFVTTTAPTDPSAALAGGIWARRVDSRREWRAFREYYSEYLPREMPLATVPSVCEGPIAYKGQTLLEQDLATLKAALDKVEVADAFVPAIAPGDGRPRTEPLLPDRGSLRLRAGRGAAHRVSRHRRRRLHSADRRPGSGRDLGHAQSRAAARGVSQDAGAQHRGPQSRACRHPGGPRALPPVLGKLAGTTRHATLACTTSSTSCSG